ncbi:X-box-binding protein 1-like [Paramacrobiotus metropolitanus]|uniref:X-box-binding protein 1-like n=1 Tax=Paramacrobiotus metropolitanus TaxID=2943436 RepID=UPI00244641E5|nr:X-box-binding protein 1-like [Paramacrobiotus metropolitanus]
MAPQILIKQEVRSVKECSPSPSITSSVESAGGKRKLDCDDGVDREKRRKLMNRVAAQQSRDRKRQYVDDLEKEIKKLRNENTTLKTDNQKLRSQNDELKIENEILKTGSVKAESCPTVTSSDASIVPEAVDSSPMAFESAALISGPLQQEQVMRMLINWLMHCVWIMQLTSTRRISSQSSRTFGQTLMERLKLLRSQIKLSCSASKDLREPWWGPHQQSWNPSKISCSADQTVPLCS